MLQDVIIYCLYWDSNSSSCKHKPDTTTEPLAEQKKDPTLSPMRHGNYISQVFTDPFGIELARTWVWISVKTVVQSASVDVLSRICVLIQNLRGHRHFVRRKHHCWICEYLHGSSIEKRTTRQFVYVVILWKRYLQEKNGSAFSLMRQLLPRRSWESCCCISQNILLCYFLYSTVSLNIPCYKIVS